MRAFALGSSLVFALSCASLGCGSSGSSNDAGTSAAGKSCVPGELGAAGSGGAPGAPHTPFPTMATACGPKITKPKLAVVMYASDPRAQDLAAHAAWLPTSSWLATVGAEYGISGGSLAGSVMLSDAAPGAAQNADTAAMLSAQVEAGALPAPDDDTVYVVHYPEDTNVGNQGVVACRSYLAYHDEGQVAGKRAPFVVVPACPSAFSGKTDTESAEIFAAQYLIDTLTDPFPKSAPGIAIRSSSSAFNAYGTEVGDLCPYLLATEGSYFVPRVWSSSRAASGAEDPCVPADDAGPMFGVTASPDGIQKVAAGASTSFVLTGWAASPDVTFKVSVRYTNSAFIPIATPSSFSSGDGMSQTISLMVPETAVSGSTGAMTIYATAPNGDLHEWPLLLFVP